MLIECLLLRSGDAGIVGLRHRPLFLTDCMVLCVKLRTSWLMRRLWFSSRSLTSHGADDCSVKTAIEVTAMRSSAGRIAVRLPGGGLSS